MYVDLTARCTDGSLNDPDVVIPAVPLPTGLCIGWNGLNEDAGPSNVGEARRVAARYTVKRTYLHEETMPAFTKKNAIEIGKFGDLAITDGHVQGVTATVAGSSPLGPTLPARTKGRKGFFDQFRKRYHTSTCMRKGSRPSGDLSGE
jgi:hypothetical protein